MAKTVVKPPRPKPKALADRLARAETTLKRFPEEPHEPEGSELSPLGDETELHGEDGRPEPLPAGAEEEETEWSASVPPETKDEAAALVASTLMYRDMVAADADRLWDWIRADADKGAKFLGKAPRTHLEMEQSLGTFLKRVAIDEQEIPIGFGAFGPQTDRFVYIHLYLCTEARGRLSQFAPAFVAECQRMFPGLQLAVLAADMAEVRLYTQFGFVAKHILTLDPPTAV